MVQERNFWAYLGWVVANSWGGKEKWQKFGGYFAISRRFPSTYKYVNHCSQNQNSSQTLANFLHKNPRARREGRKENFAKAK